MHRDFVAAAAMFAFRIFTAAKITVIDFPQNIFDRTHATATFLPVFVYAPAALVMVRR
jgi:hypothetical protein